MADPKPWAIHNLASPAIKIDETGAMTHDGTTRIPLGEPLHVAETRDEAEAWRRGALLAAGGGEMDRPIIFSAPMVRALLDGRKTQTRRLLKVPGIMGGRYPILPPEEAIELEDGEFRRGIFHYASTGALSGPYRVGYAAGDRLYVRENWRVSPEACEGWHPDVMQGWIDYQAGGSLEVVAPSFEAAEKATFLKTEDHDWDFIPSRWRPCIHMPRWASRLTLLVDDVRVERLQAISERDAEAEGCVEDSADGFPVWYTPGAGIPHTATGAECYQRLWESLHGLDSWAANPWVVAVTFRAERDNIDTLPKDQPQ